MRVILFFLLGILHFCSLLLYKGFCFTQPLSTTASLLCQTLSLVGQRSCTTLNVLFLGAGPTGFVQMLFSIFGGVPPMRVIFFFDFFPMNLVN